MRTTKPERGETLRTHHVLPAIMLLAALVSPVNALGAQFDLWLEASQDDLGIDDYYAELGITLNNGAVLQLGVGSTDYNDNGTSVSPETLMVGFSAPQDQTLVPAVRLQTWEAEGVMKTSTLRIDLGLNLDDWYLSASPLFKDIDLVVDPLMGPPRTINTEGNGFEASASWYGIEDWALGVTAGAYSYDDDLTRLNTRLAALVFSQQALTSSNALLDSWVTLSLNRYVSWGSLGASWGRTTSAVTLTDADNLSVNLSWDVTPSVALYAELGETQPDGASSIAYSRAALNLRW